MTGPVQDPHPPMPAFHPGRMVLLIERSPDRSGLVLSSPHLPGWQLTCRGAIGIAGAVEQAWREHAVRAYANAQGEPYDRTPPADTPDPPLTSWAHRWHQEDDGTWTSPSGRHYRPDAAVVGRVRAELENHQHQAAG